MFCAIDLFKQKTAYDLRISDWSSDVCSSDLWFLLPFYPLIDHWPLAAVWALLTLGTVVLLVLPWLVRARRMAGRQRSYQVALHPGPRHINARSGETVLEAGLRAGLVLPYECSTGGIGRGPGRDKGCRYV